nr:GNAT family N-acetyltransferase [Streptomyces sp. MST-110588]
MLRAQPPSAAARLADGGGAGPAWIDGQPPEGTTRTAARVVQAVAAGVYRPGWGLFTIVRGTDGTALGSIGFHGPPDEAGTVEIGYTLSPSARGAGWATAAARLLAGWAAARPEVRTVIALTASENTASQRVLERAGFTRTGVRTVDGDSLYAYEYAGVPASRTSPAA